MKINEEEILKKASFYKWTSLLFLIGILVVLMVSWMITDFDFTLGLILDIVWGSALVCGYYCRWSMTKILDMIPKENHSE